MKCGTWSTIALGIGVYVSASGSAAWADEAAPADASSELARKYNAEAKKEFSVGSFGAAAELYKKAYQAKPIADFLHNIAQCHRRMKTLEHLERAVFYFESYLSNAPDSPNREDVEAEIADLRRQIEKLRQQKIQKPTTIPTARASAVTAEPQPHPATVPPSITATPARSRPFYKRWYFWTLIGAAVVGGTVGAIAATTGGSSRMPTGNRFDASNFANK